MGTARILYAASMPSKYSVPLYRYRATWSPAPTPRAASACASRLARSSAAANDNRRGPHTNASRSGTASTTASQRSARLNSTPWIVGAATSRSHAEAIQRGVDRGARRVDHHLLALLVAARGVGVDPELGLDRGELTSNLGEGGRVGLHSVSEAGEATPGLGVGEHRWAHRWEQRHV